MDLGSPLVCKSGKRFELTGMITHDHKCAKDGRPTVFTNIASHLDWIRRIYEEDDDGTVEAAAEPVLVATS